MSLYLMLPLPLNLNFFSLLAEAALEAPARDLVDRAQTFRNSISGRSVFPPSPCRLLRSFPKNLLLGVNLCRNKPEQTGSMPNERRKWQLPSRRVAPRPPGRGVSTPVSRIFSPPTVPIAHYNISRIMSYHIRHSAGSESSHQHRTLACTKRNELLLAFFEDNDLTRASISPVGTELDSTK